MNDFAKWFVQQHGERTASGIPSCTDAELRGVAMDGRKADYVLSCRELWDDQRISALSAWNARNTDEALRDAAQAVVDRWDTQLWKMTIHTGDYIDRLRVAIDAAHTQGDKP